MRTTPHGEPFTMVATVREAVRVPSARHTATIGNAFFTAGSIYRERFAF